MKIAIYSDSSYCHITKVAACAYIILSQGNIIKNHVTIMGDVQNSTQAEILAATFGLQDGFLMNGVSEVVLCSDLKSLVDFTNIHLYKSTLKKREEVYREYRDTIHIMNECGVKVIVRHVKSHSTNQNNKLVDESAVTTLRRYLKNNQLWDTRIAI